MIIRIHWAVRVCCWLVLWSLGSSSAAAEPRPQVSLTNRVPATFAAGPQALAPETGQKGSSTAPGPLDLLDIDAAIRELYGRFSAISKASGQEVSFVITGITTYRGQQLEEVRWLDLFTWQPGPNIETVPHSRSALLPSQETVTYRMTWKDGKDGAEQKEAFGRSAARFSAAEALELLINNEPDRFSGTVAITTFEVEVHFEGKSRAYRALVGWKPLGPESVLFTLSDNVVSDVDVAFHEDRIIVKPDAPREPRHGALDNCPAAQLVNPPDPPDPPGCGETSANVVALDLERGGESIQLGRAEIPLYYSEPSNETHRGQPVRYLMAEWAVVSVPGLLSRDSWSPKPFMRSSEAFDEATANALVGAVNPQLQGEVSAENPRPVLLVALPSHEANSRQIAMPELQISGDPPPRSGQRGQVLLLADFAEDHRLQRLVLLHDTLGGVPRELMLHFERTLSLASPTTEKHRVVVFALFSVGDTIEIDSLIPYLPRCCCGDTFCI